MGISRVINRRTAVLGLLLVILATAGFGFAATNTVPASGAGDGAGDISGYAVAAVDYDLDATDPGVIAAMKFTLAPANTAITTPPNSVKAQVHSTGGWYTCTVQSNAAPWAYTCTGGNTTVSAADQLRVVAAN